MSLLQRNRLDERPSGAWPNGASAFGSIRAGDASREMQFRARLAF